MTQRTGSSPEPSGKRVRMLQWLSIDRGSAPRNTSNTSSSTHKHHRDSPSRLSRTSSTTTATSKSRRKDHPPPSLLREEKRPPATPQIVVPGRIHRARHNTSNTLDRDKNEQRRGHKRSETVPTMLSKQFFDDEPVARTFTVSNVGAGGTLFLRPTRTPIPDLYAPVTPSATSSERSSRPLLRDSDISAWTLRHERPRTMAGSLVLPPMASGNSHNRRTRSHSESTVRTEANEFSLPPVDRPPLPRRRSSADLPRGVADVYIPHYRLGTPRFSDRGTAYLHYSMHTTSTDGVPSSVLSRAEYDKVFPVPPGRDLRSFHSHVSGAPFLHPLSAYSRSTISRPPVPSTRPSTIAVTGPGLFEKLESNLDDPSVVHYHPTTGRIVAATPARLVAQITSPQFLDYELLADFFLTFRSFMPCRDVLEYLFARMRWAFEGGNDAGRIARVRTFVALRHWILNYFVDDFMADLAFRQNFCDLVNELARSLRRRPDHGGGDINIVGELKKCWRRTSAMYWPTPDAQEASPDADIIPGGEPEEQPVPIESALSLPLTIRPTTRSHSIFEMTQIQLPDRPGGFSGASQHLSGPSQRSTATTRTASIPASPTSEQSLEVLSCSVPFLRNIRPTARSRQKQTAPPRALQTQGRAGKPTARPKHGHKRSGSFSDALRDHRTPLSSPKIENIELKDLPSFAITGGLVRGILLQPTAARVDNNVPVTPGPPGPELTEARLAVNEGFFGQSPHHQHLGVKKFVGEVRRALSSRKGSSQSPSRSLGSASSGSESRGRPIRAARKPQPDWQQLPGPSRLDVLGSRIETAYQGAFEQTRKDRPQTQELGAEELINEGPVIPNDGISQQAMYHDRPLPDLPRPLTPRATAMSNNFSVAQSSHDSTSVMDFGRLNSHVTTGSRSIVIVDATGAPRIPTISGAMHSMSSMSSDMMPIPLFREKSETPPVPSIPQDHSGDWKSEPPPTRSRETDGWRTSDERMHVLLTAPSSWGIHDDSRGGSYATSQHSNIPRRSSSLVRSPDADAPPVRHQLKRRPGGDLKAADHVHDLEKNVRPRAHRSFSEGTSVTSPLSATQSTILFMPSAGLSPNLEPKKKKSVSLIMMQTSQPILRPSFVGEAERLKGLPDPESDGGIEDALLKLEGKIPSPSRSEFSRSDDRHGSGRSQTPDSPLRPPPLLKKMPSGELKVMHPKATLDMLSVNGVAPLTESPGARINHPSMSGINSTNSMVAYALPQISPAAMEPGSSTNSPTSVVPIAVRMGPFPGEDSIPAYLANGASSPDSFPYEQKPESIPDSVSNVHYPSYRPGAWSGEVPTSLLLDDNQSLSDISTDIASHHEDGVHSFYFDDTATEGALPIMPDQATPPKAVGTFLSQSPELRRQLQRPRDPDRPLKEAISAPRLLPQTPNQPFPRRPYRGPKPEEMTINTQTFPSHLPFVLAFESEVIAEQLTIIEKDALDEVDWKDLISLNWQQTPPDVRNWVDYLNKENANGIDIVIARFNLVVKWCVSEIVLTEVVSERARAITKYIHIAAHCHRLHNFSSMYQIVLALLSTDLARLHKTWSLVALREKQMLEHLEQLCRPVRNFHSLRAEMETAMPGNGIIPFIGLYTHDLMFNALKSPRISPPQPNREALINFERFQTAANIVKNLLRLIEASSRYAFAPEPEALSRCLWIAALDDHEIAARSRALEAV